MGSGVHRVPFPMMCQLAYTKEDEMFKLSDAYLCPDCNTVFEPDRTLMIHVKNPVCPGCGNRFNMSIGKVMNRREEPPPVPIVDARGFFLQGAV
jgi:protein-arginine kinase activator protein McsA